MVAIVGRPNVGKSTLFNRISGSRLAVVRQEPGVTRDRLYTHSEWQGRNFSLVDTGGMDFFASQDISRQIIEQAQIALEEAQVIVMTVDYTQGITPLDQEIVAHLRKKGKPILLAVNKVDGKPDEGRLGEFYSLGLDRVLPVSAEHGLGIGDLLDDVVEFLPPAEEGEENQEKEEELRIAVVGRPNTGKSTLINYILGQPRMIVSPEAGTTRDSVDTPIQYQNKKFVLIDTAGLRRKSKVNHVLEKYSVIKALKSIDRCHIAFLMLDASEGVTDQDGKIAGYIAEAGKGCIFVVNKWDLAKAEKKQEDFIEQIYYNIKFLHYAPVCFTTAQTGIGVQRLMNLSLKVWDHYRKRISTANLNDMLRNAVQRHQPASYKGQLIKMNYLTQVGVMPPTFMVFMNHPQGLHFSYERYLENCVRKEFGLTTSPIRIITRQK